MTVNEQHTAKMAVHIHPLCEGTALPALLDNDKEWLTSIKLKIDQRVRASLLEMEFD